MASASARAECRCRFIILPPMGPSPALVRWLGGWVVNHLTTQPPNKGWLSTMGEVDVAWMFDGLVIVQRHANGLLVIRSLKDDGFIVGEAVIHDGRHLVEAAERRHRAALAIGKEAIHFLLGGQFDARI